MQHNHTEEKAEMIKKGSSHSFVNHDEWEPYNLWCIDNLNKMIKKENENNEA